MVKWSLSSFITLTFDRQIGFEPCGQVHSWWPRRAGLIENRSGRSIVVGLDFVGKHHYKVYSSKSRISLGIPLLCYTDCSAADGTSCPGDRSWDWFDCLMIYRRKIELAVGWGVVHHLSWWSPLSACFATSMIRAMVLPDAWSCRTSFALSIEPVSFSNYHKLHTRSY